MQYAVVFGLLLQIWFWFFLHQHYLNIIILIVEVHIDWNDDVFVEIEMFDIVDKYHWLD
jgi:hypothetical protein